MNKDTILYLVVGLLTGSLVTILFSRYSFNSSMSGMMEMMGYRSNMMGNESQFENDEDEGMHMGSSMNQMMKSLEGRKGDDFDRSFMEAMTVHHQGAVEMAKQVENNANHQELKTMAKDIISAQTNEINIMEKWQQEWEL